MMFVLVHAQARQRAVQAVKDAPDGMVVKIVPATRSLEQNAKLHAMIGDVAKQTNYFGRKLTTEQWKIIFISGHAIATGLGADVIAGLESEFVNIRESSAKMSVTRMQSLIEYITIWAMQNNIKC